MLSVRVQKDIGEYTEKIVGKLSARTLVCLAGGLASAVGTAVICQFMIGIEVRNAALPVMCASMPFWLAGFWRPYHMKLEKFVPLWLDFQLEDQRVFYRSTPMLEGAQPAPAPGNPSRKARRKAKRKGAELYDPARKQKKGVPDGESRAAQGQLARPRRARPIGGAG